MNNAVGKVDASSQAMQPGKSLDLQFQSLVVKHRVQ
jgi:hypothetical protein